MIRVDGEKYAAILEMFLGDRHLFQSYNLCFADKYIYFVSTSNMTQNKSRTEFSLIIMEP